MKYSIEIGKIVEGALRHDQVKVLNYTKQLIAKLEEAVEERFGAIDITFCGWLSSN